MNSGYKYKLQATKPEHVATTNLPDVDSLSDGYFYYKTAIKITNLSNGVAPELWSQFEFEYAVGMPAGIIRKGSEELAECYSFRDISIPEGALALFQTPEIPTLSATDRCTLNLNRYAGNGGEVVMVDASTGDAWCEPKDFECHGPELGPHESTVAYLYSLQYATPDLGYAVDPILQVLDVAIVGGVYGKDDTYLFRGYQLPLP